ncbi:efflux RND transporter periplasmic adaptor subunit [Helicobacter canadensis]|uniref:efflux RND transporter periplasmic adaptor subunit n=1 Tax=Helicobacter canadensis TaxID=123841 RepID=UPI000E03E4F7|nr:efflux RND transporter periplasmic adaptor subunit [Helicobacter canadensis]STO99261.1 toluene efflux pump periplasmic linker protein [Helicobacter canadensis]
MKGYHKILLGTFCSLVIFSGCFGEKDSKAQQQTMVIPVSTYTVEIKDTPVSFEYPTQLTSPQKVEVYARVEGTLLEQNFVEGNVVKEGQKLFKIDPSKYQANVNIAKAQLLSAQATFKEASRDWERSKKLFEQKALSPKERDQSLSTYENAQAGVANAKANLDNAMIDLGYTDVVATATGKTSLTNYDLGNLVGSASSSNALVTVTQLDPINAEFSIPSKDYYFFRTLNRDNLKVFYILPSGNTYSKEGKLDFIDSVVDASTAIIKARAIVENQDFLLIPGEFSRIRLEGLIAKNTITIPQIALLQDAQGSYVYKVVDGKAVQTRVVLGQSVGNSFLIQSGLQEGDRIITDQLVKLRPGAPVNIINTQAQ